MFRSEIVKLDSVKWNGEDTAEMVFNGWTFWGAKRKDFFGPDTNWEKDLVPGCELRVWTIQFSRVMGIEWWDEEDGEFKGMWAVGNDFQTKAERDASTKAYCDFIESEGKVVTQLIDEGKDLDEINKYMDGQGHSGNTHAHALHIGITNAKNRENADKVKRAHNKFWGKEEAAGTINPCLITVGTK